MRIDGLGTPNVGPISGGAAHTAGTSNTQSFNASAAALALQLEEQKGGGGGGHGGGHAKKTAMSSIEDIAARESLNIAQRKKSMLDRMRDIEKLKEAMAAEAEKVGEKKADGEEAEADRDREGEDGHSAEDDQPS